MPDNPNKLSQFWQELKRRKVVRVITVYAAAAFVILELTDIVAPSLGLPDWTLNFIIILLCAGFIITVIVSWIYDIHPEGGVVKTEPAQKVKEEKPVSSKGWKIASYISFVVIVALIVLNVAPRNNKKEILEKSIAVLPFINDSEDIGNEHIINGIMEEILINLQSIKELRVPGRTSIEQYRNNPKPIPEISSEMDVAYIVEGSGQRYGNTIRLRVQLVEGATDKHLWADSYDEEIKDPEDIFRIQSQIAKSIAAELKAVITPEEKQLIEKVPTTSLTAYDFYQRGREVYLKYNWRKYNIEILESTEDFYNKALEHDSTFAQAYAGLAEVYLHKDWDSVLILAAKALSYDNQLADAYTVKGQYYIYLGKVEQANEEFDKALQLNPNDYQAYIGKGDVAGAKLEYINRLNYLHIAASLSRGSEFPALLRRLGLEYLKVGFPEKSKSYFQQALRLDGDSAEYYTRLTRTELFSGNFKKAIEYGLKRYTIDSVTPNILEYLGLSYLYFGQYEESLKYYEKYVERMNTLGNEFIHNPHEIGSAYWKNGYEKEAEYYFSEQRRYCEWWIEMNDRQAQSLAAYYDLATIYAFKGEKGKAYENLRIFNQREVYNTGLVTSIKNDPLFDNIRDEPEFQQIVSDMEDKYQAEHERVRQWLEENDML